MQRRIRKQRKYIDVDCPAWLLVWWRPSTRTGGGLTSLACCYPCRMKVSEMQLCGRASTHDAMGQTVSGEQLQGDIMVLATYPDICFSMNHIVISDINVTLKQNITQVLGWNFFSFLFCWFFGSFFVWCCNVTCFVFVFLGGGVRLRGFYFFITYI